MMKEIFITSSWVRAQLFQTWYINIENGKCCKSSRAPYEVTNGGFAATPVWTCVETCAGSWFACAKEVLKTNGINVYTYANSIRRCLRKGRQKQNNIMLVGPTNCGKSFLFDPLEMIFKTTVNPSLTSYAWVGLDKHEIAYLIDFRYSKECIKWSDFLLLLERHTVNLPRP